MLMDCHWNNLERILPKRDALDEEREISPLRHVLRMLLFSIQLSMNIEEVVDKIVSLLQKLMGWRENS